MIEDDDDDWVPNNRVFTWAGAGYQALVFVKDVFQSAAEFVGEIASDLAGEANHSIDLKRSFRETSRELEQIPTKEP